MTRIPSPDQTPDYRPEVGDPSEHSDLLHVEAEALREVDGKPVHEEPPDGVDEESGKDNGPGLPISQGLPPV